MTAWYSSSDPLRSARLKIDRAKSHIDDWARRKDAFFEREPKPYSVIPKDDVQTAPHTFRCIVRESPPMDWSLITGDALTNLRAALDHAVWALSYHGLGEDPGSAVSFPITDHPDSFRKRASTALQHIPVEARDVIEGFQPYRRDERPHNDLLKALNGLVNRDKHRVIQPVYGRLMADIEGEDRIVFGILHDGYRIAIPAQPRGDLNVQFIVSIAMDFDDKRVGPDGLLQMHDLVRDEVLPALAGFFE